MPACLATVLFVFWRQNGNYEKPKAMDSRYPSRWHVDAYLIWGGRGPLSNKTRKVHREGMTDWQGSESNHDTILSLRSLPGNQYYFFKLIY